MLSVRVGSLPGRRLDAPLDEAGIGERASQRTRAARQAPYAQRELGTRERARDEVVGAGPEHGLRGRGSDVAADPEHTGRATGALVAAHDLAQYFQPVELRKVHVEHH